MRIGILGCGHVSDQYFHGIRQWDFLEVTACADLDPVRAREKAAQHEVRATSPEELLADDEIDLVVNLTPPLAHAETSLRIIDAGKHVWSEKPLAAELESARAVVDAAAAAGVRIGCAPDTFLGGSIQTSVKLVDDGWIGRPLSAVAFVSEPGYEHFHPAVESFYARGAGPVGAVRRSVYCMTKHAIEGLVKAAAVELAEHGVRVNAVAPTFVETPMTAPFLADDGFRADVTARIPLGRLGRVEDVTAAVVYLASDDASLVTGTSLVIDGGWTAQ